MEIRKPLLDKKKLRGGEITFENCSFVDELLVSLGDLGAEVIPEIKVSTSSISHVSFVATKVEDFTVIDSLLLALDFVGAVIERIFLERVVFTKCRLQGTQFLNALVRDTIIEKSKCADVSFRFAKMKNVIFDECDLENADFLGATLDHVVFKNCSLLNAQFSQAKLMHVNFKESNIQGIAIGKDSFGDITVNTGQAIYLASRLGLHIED